MMIGVDPHKRQHTAAALERLAQRQRDSITVEASLAGYRRLLAWAKQWPQRTWAVENARGLGRHLAQWLLARGETVVDVPATATRRVRELSRGGRRKNDLCVFVSVAARQQPRECERVGDAEVPQSQQHEAASSPVANGDE